MALFRGDPLLAELESMTQDLDQAFGRLLGNEGARGRGWLPPADIYETEDRFVVHVELPGIEPDSVDLSVEDSTLTIRGERGFYDEVNEDSFHRVERRFGSFMRSLTLPQTADAERIQAGFDKGVLTIEVPKVEQAKPRRIEIKATG